ncbi:MucR family transcriptional regulator [Pararhizobium haloflavum]|uniref:MucR family transcriptional regulator n=1 Tax=Pararhizobium haloflavum TaxID=2037914 RepID=UPI000C18D6EA|nr:MucR family transcriptional regulator [Pararhizobium haloflavum]
MKELLIENTTAIVAAYVSNVAVNASDMPGFIASVHKALADLAEDKPDAEKPKPAVSVAKSVTENEITCLDCGSKFQSLKRHINAHHGLTPEGYRAKWGLAPNYPMTAPAYANKRSAIAKTMGLGRKAGV